MGRAPCCDKANVKKGPWSPEEDAKLREYIEKHGNGGNWIALPQKVGLKRCGKSCRLRWLNYLRPNIKHGEFSEAEDRVICNLFATIGSSSSDGSCNNSNQINHVIEKEFGYGIYQKVGAVNYLCSEVEDTKKFVMSNGCSVGGLWGENPLDYGNQEIEELIISTSSCNNFLFDDKKTEERVMYY
ncbi:hypothetical protein RIF29_39930 [Crotalaria pallida]|uniref:Uncharacterized protein n=1 Tax=Crotalaria pallida TaxID=3830 RepID=A0AAN9E3T0_CROPI